MYGIPNCFLETVFLGVLDSMFDAIEITHRAKREMRNFSKMFKDCKTEHYKARTFDSKTKT